MSWFSLVGGDQLKLSQHVPLDGVEQFRAVHTGRQISAVERIDDEVIVMWLARRRRRTAVNRTPEPRQTLHGAANFRRHRRVRFERDIFRKATRRGREGVG